MIFKDNVMCPKCKSMRIKQVIVDVEEPLVEEIISMDDLPNESLSGLIHAVYKPINYKATCKDCGYEVRWVR